MYEVKLISELFKYPIVSNYCLQKCKREKGGDLNGPC